MREVSCQITSLIFDYLDREAISVEALLEGLPTSVSVLRNPKDRISWELYAELMDRLQTQLGGLRAIEKITHRHHESPHFAVLRRLGSLVISARNLYWMGATWHGKSVFSNVEAQFEDAGEGKVRVTLEIPKAYRDSPAFFHLMLGALPTAPMVLGQSEAEVHMELQARRAVYTITLPPSLTLQARISRAVRAPFAGRHLIRELSTQHAQIKQSYEELRAAHEKIRSQASQLERISFLGRQLAERTELDELSSEIVGLLQSHFYYRGVSLWINDSEKDELRLLRKAGSEENHHSSHPLVSGNQLVGHLDVWDPAPPPDSEPVAMLDQFLPWISVALENARAFQEIRRQAQRLELTVQERTWDLTQTNNRLRREVRQREVDAEALKQSQQQLLASERLASVGTLASGIAHEINNPVGSILASAQYAESSRGEADEAEVVGQALADIVRESKRCGQIVRSVLQFARDEPTEKWVEDLNQIVGNAIRSTLAYAAERQVGLETAITADRIWVRVNPVALLQVVVNLIRNAIEAGGPQSRVQIQTETQGETARVLVSDSGRGITESEQRHIFDPFYTTRRADGGSGLGLSIVHGIIHEHRGQIKIESTPGQGTQILVELPVAES